MLGKFAVRLLAAWGRFEGVAVKEKIATRLNAFVLVVSLSGLFAMFVADRERYFPRKAAAPAAARGARTWSRDSRTRLRGGVTRSKLADE